MRAEFILLRMAAAFRNPQRLEESAVWAPGTDGERDPDQAQAQARLVLIGIVSLTTQERSQVDTAPSRSA